MNTVYRNIHALVLRQCRNYQTEIDQQRITRLLLVNVPLFALLNGQVTNTALRKMYLELEHTGRPDFPALCTCPTLTVMGYPCGHFLRCRQASGEPVPLSTIHRHWRYEPLRVDPSQSSTQQVIRAPRRRLQQRRVDDTSSSAEDIEDNVPWTTHEVSHEGTISDLFSTQGEEAIEAERQPPVSESAASRSRRESTRLRRTHPSGQHVLNTYV